MDENHKIAAIVAPICWALGLVGALILIFALDKDIRKAWTLSYVLGIMVGLLNLGLMVKGAKHLEKAAKDPDGKPVRMNMLYFLMRMAVLVAIFAMVIVNQATAEVPKFNVWSTLIGYLLVKVVLIIVVLIRKGKVKTE